MIQLHGVEQGDGGPDKGLQKIIGNGTEKETSPVNGNEKLQGFKPFDGESVQLPFD